MAATHHTLQGMSVSPGVAIGKAFVLHSREVTVQAYALTDQEVEAETARFKRAVQSSQKQVENLREQVAEKIDQAHAAIFDTHLLILQDPLLIDETLRRIREERKNAEFVLSQVTDHLVGLFANLQDDYFSARHTDIQDVCHRILNNLMEIEHRQLADLTEPVVVVAHDLTPSDTAHMTKDKVLGFVTEAGSLTSHTAIMAKALEIPAIVGCEGVLGHVRTGDPVALDALKGLFVVNPAKEELIGFKRSGEDFERSSVALEGLRHLPAETLDGYRVELSANIELPKEVEQVKRYGADGIGLFRTEFIYLDRAHLPTEEEQYEVYSGVLTAMSPKSVIFRTLDLGGDKFISPVPLGRELNPFLGLRAIRLCLEYPDVFRTQLRAILRASSLGNAKIMFPMVSSVREVQAAKALLEETKTDLKKEDKPFDDNLEVGIMIEIPAAAVAADLLAPEVDFFSIGTNDLIQYTIAVDRVNEKVAHLYEPLHPSILRLIRNVANAAHQAGIWVGLCGEMAADPVTAIILVGIGIDELSVGPVAIPELKSVIRGLRLSETKELVGDVFRQKDVAAVKALIREFSERRAYRLREDQIKV
ncbi:MAG: phosphoenolpyruvate--protein phosphotransferase [bacterium]